MGFKDKEGSLIEKVTTKQRHKKEKWITHANILENSNSDK